MLSIIIPTLNAAGTLERTLKTVAPADFVLEMIVADGVSTDGTPDIARANAAKVVTAATGRGQQLAAGAATALAPWLLFLHADTVPGEGWADAVKRFIADPNNADRAAVFRFRLDDDTAAARRLEGLVDWRTRNMELPYGDQGLLIAKAHYDRIGGFKPMPLMEDVDLVRRLGRNRITVLAADAITSAEKYRKHGYLLRPARNALCLGLYLLGLPPKLIAKFY
ncbi:MAG: TIGR04283 family arsenosugar biosynthesis glycosyltransferase [Rhodospirillales bacterium]|nr:TIGR04283 family arsenosugar biosynthesis glycosyltransferase [Rhodospirillales bacterium]